MASFSDTVAEARTNLAMQEGRTPPEHNKLLAMLMALRRRGKQEVDNRREDMEKADRIYQAFIVPDEKDKKSAERGEPIKIVFPVTYAQCQTAISQLLTIFLQNPFYPLESRGPKQYNNAKLMELELQYQLEEAGMELIAYQALLDIMKYGYGKINIGYDRKKDVVVSHNNLVKQFPLVGQIFGIPETSMQEVVGYEGASLRNENPYEVIFDPSFSIGEFQRGEFVFSRERKTYNDLQDNERYYNLERLPMGPSPTSAQTFDTAGGEIVKGSNLVNVDTAYVKLVPRDYSLSEYGKVQIWKFVIANESRIILAEPMPFYHGQFPAVVGEYCPDLHSTSNPGLAQTIDGMQDWLNWQLNSHQAAVKKMINLQALVDPDNIEIEDLEKRREYIRMKRGKGGLMDRTFKQLLFQDVTQGHVRDSENMLAYIQRTSGYSENTMGVQLPTGRTATEVAAMTRGGSARTKLSAQLLWRQMFQPMGEQMIKNTQQFMEIDRFMNVSGGLMEQLGIDPSLLKGDLLKISPADLQGFFKIKLVDVNSSTDKMVIANVLKEIIVAASQNPLMVQAFGLKPQAIFMRMLSLFGVPGLNDLVNPLLPDQQAVMQHLMQGGKAQIVPTPDSEVLQEQAKGNLIPFNGGPGDSRRIPTA